MDKNERTAILFSGLSICVTLCLFIFTEFFCGGNCPVFSGNQIEYVYVGILGLSPTLLLLLLFERDIFIFWIRHIAWWFAIVIATIVSNTSDGSIVSPDREWITFFLMAVLFIVTLVYALIMNKKLKNS